MRGMKVITAGVQGGHWRTAAAATLLGILAAWTIGQPSDAKGSEPPAGVTDGATVTMPRVSLGVVTDGAGCQALDVWGPSGRVRAIASNGQACSTLGRQVRIGQLLYFAWTARWAVTTVGAADGWRQATELWVTDGTTTGTGRITVLRDGHGPSQDTCGSGWGAVATEPIAYASWCTDRTTRSWMRGRVVVAWGTRTERKPVPRPLFFAIANHRIVTTGQDGHGRELWVHDRVVRVVDIRPGPAGSDPHRFITDGSSVRFIADDGSGRAEWVTDGTIAGTHRIGAIPVSVAAYPLVSAGQPRVDGAEAW